ncbi:hypothetical protein [Amycolatopsis sp. NPDC059657]|uniref:hypothetical protein n=1 Tax=Amycolatopsis sp. NPDC059657 TaxID=3346899 RepID=UPI00366EF69F
MADFLDRLLARSVPGCPAPAGEALVVPRLPQPFEQFTNGLEQEEFVAAPSRRSPTPVAQVPSPPAVAAIETHNEIPATPIAATAPAAKPWVPAARQVTTTSVLRPQPPVVTGQPRTEPGETRVEQVTEQHLTTVNVSVSPGEPSATLLPSTTTVVVPALPGEARRAPETAARRGDPPPQPPVRISIGRVEVKATEAAKPAAKTRPSRAEPAVSLERYLSEEGRR